MIPNQLSFEALSNKDLLLLAIGSRFASNVVTFIGTIWSYIKFGNPEAPLNVNLRFRVVLFFMLFGIIFLNDISSLPVNIFYFWSLLSGANLSSQWIQALAFGSPIVSGVVFVIGNLLVDIVVSKYGATELWEYAVGEILFLPHLVQLVPSIAYAIYVKDVAV